MKADQRFAEVVAYMKEMKPEVRRCFSAYKARDYDSTGLLYNISPDPRAEDLPVVRKQIATEPLTQARDYDSTGLLYNISPAQDPRAEDLPVVRKQIACWPKPARDGAKVSSQLYVTIGLITSRVCAVRFRGAFGFRD
ncbi:hypothetical protein AK812_SmicGene15902 [Symbiodinium microadriaticum]|uniref:Uncharacterized protein n=1 Tax=Symbiodinium microadriaticum TaxID=2951 RepID=A0A1Q9E1Q2_SYMMI|nr:hypothetical protein AK812_SmicGene15902 [Symbiodinium microadriaticum]